VSDHVSHPYTPVSYTRQSSRTNLSCSIRPQQTVTKVVCTCYLKLLSPLRREATVE
jgi:hypothetical protein